MYIFDKLPGGFTKEQALRALICGLTEGIEIADADLDVLVPQFESGDVTDGGIAILALCFDGVDMAAVDAIKCDRVHSGLCGDLEIQVIGSDRQIDVAVLWTAIEQAMERAAALEDTADTEDGEDAGEEG